MRLRAAVFLVAASTTLVLAPAASAGVLGLTASPLTGRAATAPAAGAVTVGLDVVTPVAEAHLQVSAPGVAAGIATPRAGVEVSVERKKQKPAAAAQKKQRRTPAGGAATLGPEVLPTGVRAAPASSPLHASTAATAAAPGAPLPLEPTSGAPSTPSFALEAASAAGGVPAALAGAVLVAFLLLSQVSRVPARTLRPPLLSLDLQRPG